MLKEELTNRGKRVIVTHFADLVKYVCKAFFNWDGNKDEHGRWLLQHVGTDIVRAQNPDYWAWFVYDMLDFLDDDRWDYAIIPDTRFPNEVDLFKTGGFEASHIRVVRSNFNSTLTEEAQNHPSETALDNVAPDYLIENSGDMDDLCQKVIELIKENLDG